MATDVADMVGSALGRVARETVETVSTNARKRTNGTLSGTKGIATGIGLVALAPLAAKGAGKLVRGIGSNGGSPISDVGDKLGETVKGAGKSLLPGGGPKGGKAGKSQGGKAQGVQGVGKGRRMPIQQDIDIGMPIKTVYNQWTQFEDWPSFMHRLEQVNQEDNTHLSFKTKIWGVSKEFKAEILEQVPEERIKWEVTEGVIHHGVVTFHELAPRLTRVEVNLDVEPGSLIEKAARGMRHVKRAVRADMARFKAYVLMEGEETGAWRGRVEEGKVKRASSSRPSSSSRRSGSSSGRSRASGRSSASSSSGAKSRSSRSRSSSNGKQSSSSRTRASSSRGGSRSSRSKSSSSS